MVGVRTRFVCDVVDVARRQHGAEPLRSVEARLPERIKEFKSFDELRVRSAGDVMPIADAEHVLLALDQTLKSGTGALLEAAGHEIFFRILAQGSLPSAPDLAGTMARLRVAIERPFVDVAIDWTTNVTSRGFVLFLVVPQRPRSARILQHLLTGAVHAGQRFVTRLIGDRVTIFGETIGDRVSLDVHLPAPRERGDASERISSVPSERGLQERPVSRPGPAIAARTPSQPPARDGRPISVKPRA